MWAEVEDPEREASPAPLCPRQYRGPRQEGWMEEGQEGLGPRAPADGVGAEGKAGGRKGFCLMTWASCAQWQGRSRCGVQMEGYLAGVKEK